MQPIIVDPQRVRDRLVRGHSIAAAIIGHMKNLGVEARLFGSMKTSDIVIGSDIDILVVDCGLLDHDEIAFQIHSLPSDIPVDVVFLDEIAAHARPSFLAAAGG